MRETTLSLATCSTYFVGTDHTAFIRSRIAFGGTTNAHAQIALTDTCMSQLTIVIRVSESENPSI